MNRHAYFRQQEKNYLAHHGVKGQKWGVRRYQNPDGTLTPEGQERYKTEKNFNTVRKGINYMKKQLVAPNMVDDDELVYLVSLEAADLYAKSMTEEEKEKIADYIYEDFMNLPLYEKK